MYYEYEEPIQKVVPHRVLAMNRGEKEGILKIAIEPPADQIKAYLEKQIIKHRETPVKETLKETLKEAIEDSYKRLIQPAIERDIRKELSEKADAQAIHIFAENLRKLLLQPPMKGKVVLGVDPASVRGANWQLLMRREKC